MLFAFVACENTPRYFTLSKTYYDVLGTSLDIMVILEENADTEKAKLVMNNVAEQIRSFEALISSNTQNFPNSEIVRFNNSAQNEKTEISTVTADVFSLAKELYYKTNGFYDPTVYYLVEYWGFGNYGSDVIESRKQPYSERVNMLLNTVNFDSINLISENGKYYLEKTAFPVEYEGRLLETALDFGGIGKGFAADMAKRLLAEAGYTSGYVSMGTSSIQLLENPTEKDGKIRVSLINPRADETGSFNYGEVKAQNTAISGSGDYQKFFIENDKRYCHIINPKTGFPVDTGIIASTVICKNAAMGDALSTVLMCMDFDEIRQFVNSDFFRQSSITCAVICDNGNGSFTVYDNIGIEITAKGFIRKGL